MPMKCRWIAIVMTTLLVASAAESLSISSRWNGQSQPQGLSNHKQVLLQLIGSVRSRFQFPQGQRGQRGPRNWRSGAVVSIKPSSTPRPAPSIPEPGAAAAFAVGLGVVGLVTRRRSQRR